MKLQHFINYFLMTIVDFLRATKKETTKTVISEPSCISFARFLTLTSEIGIVIIWICHVCISIILVWSANKNHALLIVCQVGEHFGFDIISHKCIHELEIWIVWDVDNSSKVQYRAFCHSDPVVSSKYSSYSIPFMESFQCWLLVLDSCSVRFYDSLNLVQTVYSHSRLLTLGYKAVLRWNF